MPTPVELARQKMDVLLAFPKTVTFCKGDWHHAEDVTKKITSKAWNPETKRRRRATSIGKKGLVYA